jgi:hypothetical protein
VDEIDRAERPIRGYAAHLAEHPRWAYVEISRYPPRPAATRSSIHPTVALHDDGSEVTGLDHAALARGVAEETRLAVDPDYTGVFRWARRGQIVYWWDWRQPLALP